MPLEYSHFESIPSYDFLGIFIAHKSKGRCGCNMLSPNEAYNEFGPLERRWKNYYDPSKRKEKK